MRHVPSGRARTGSGSVRGAASWRLAHEASKWAALLLLTLVLPGARTFAADDAMLARSEVRGSGAAGHVFFLPAPGDAGAVAVGAAHSFDRTRLAEVGEIAFRPLIGRGLLASSRRYFTAPGRPYHEPGARARDDFIVFALEAAPRDVRVLEPASALPELGDRVRIPGVRQQRAPQYVELRGTVVKSEAGAIEIDLEGPADLRGWGGAPVLEADRDVVIGLLQAAWPSGHLTRTKVGPISGVIEALAAPYEEGLGRLFATLAPQASAANSSVRRRRAATGTPYGDISPLDTAARLDAALSRRALPSNGPTEEIEIQIDTPDPDAIFGERGGAFVAGHALAQEQTSGRFDIFIVIDTSASTAAATGVDVDGDGEVGVPTAEDEETSTDPGDSVLAAEIVAAEKLIAGLDPTRTRVGIVSFAGQPVIQVVGDRAFPQVRVAALTQEPLTSDYRRVRHALTELEGEGSRGMTHMAAGIDLATLELLGLAGSVGSADPDSAKMILFFTDGQPTLPDLSSEYGNVGAVLEAAKRARRAGVRIHSFAIGPEALEGPIATVEMAAITEGTFTPVRYPGRLVEFVDEVRFAHVDELLVTNKTTERAAHDVRLHADGSWDALVPLTVGKNRLEVLARSTLGTEARTPLLVHYAPGSGRPVIPAELAAKYTDLLQRRLVAIEAERVEATRRELVIEIERERARAFQRAETQRKELELQVESEGS